MANTLETLRTLSAAEEFFEHLGVPYDPAVIRVNRLHVLKRFNQYLLGSQPDVAGLEAGAQLQACRELLIRAYQDFDAGPEDAGRGAVLGLADGLAAVAADAALEVDDHS